VFGRATRRIIVTADDFGMDLAINEAVEAAHREGVLTSASLMVTGRAVDDAVARARALPELGVGLHLALVDAAPALPPGKVRELVEKDGRFPADPRRQARRLFSSGLARQQARQEMRAQFARFRQTELAFDYVDGHHHFHLHPAVLPAVLLLAKEFGVPAVRVPLEPAWNRFRPGLWLRNLQARRLRRRARKVGLLCNDRLVPAAEGRALATLQRLLGAPPRGLTEIYLHPAARAWQPGDPWPADHDGEAELRALRDPSLNELAAAKPGLLATFRAVAAETAARQSQRT